MNLLNIDLRFFKCPDSTLIQRSDLLVLVLGRDHVEVATRGVTALTMTNFGGLITNFIEVPTDIEFRGAITQQMDIRNAMRAKVMKGNVMIRNMAMNKWGDRAGNYTVFGWDGISEMPDNDFWRHTVRVVNQATLQLAFTDGLATEGLTSAMLTDLAATNQEYNDAIDNASFAISARTLGAHLRVKTGNILFKEFVRLCNIGKELFNGVDGAKYKDYLIGLSSVPATEEGDEFGSVNGTASHSVNGHALAGIQVTLSGNDLPDLVLSTNANGIYSEEHVSTGYTTLMAAKVGFLVYTATIVIAPNEELVHDILMAPDNA